jgi:hypothetical protein
VVVGPRVTEGSTVWKKAEVGEAGMGVGLACTVAGTVVAAIEPGEQAESRLNISAIRITTRKFSLEKCINFVSPAFN